MNAFWVGFGCGFIVAGALIWLLAWAEFRVVSKRIGRGG